MTLANCANSLGTRNVHLWRIVLKDMDRNITEVLSSEERYRASRFRFEDDRREFTVTRGVLRHLLAAYAGGRPEALCFHRREGGKPVVAGGIQFNVSHCHSVAVIAISRHTVGVDVEYVAMDFPWTSIVKNFFSDTEHRWIMGLPESSRTRAFFQCWTRREAYVKARGAGIPTEQACGLSHLITEGETSWYIHSFAPFPGYIGAIAVEGTEHRIHFLDWDTHPHRTAA